MSTYFYRPESGHGLPHNPFNSIIAPRPIGWVSTQDELGTLNLAPFSFFNAFNYIPPIVGFSCTGARDSLENVRSVKQFCWNLVTEDLAEAMNETSAEVPAEVNEFELSGLTPAASEVVDVPHVAQARVVFECRVSQILPLTGLAGEETPATVVFGVVVGVHLDKSLLHDGIYDTAAARPISRGGGPATYFGVSAEQQFEMLRPEARGGDPRQVKHPHD